MTNLCTHLISFRHVTQTGKVVPTALGQLPTRGANSRFFRSWFRRGGVPSLRFFAPRFVNKNFLSSETKNNYRYFNLITCRFCTFPLIVKVFTILSVLMKYCIILEIKGMFYTLFCLKKCLDVQNELYALWKNRRLDVMH